MFNVAIHDVAPRFREPIDAILQELRPLVGDAVTAGVTPRWHGDPLIPPPSSVQPQAEPEYRDWLQSQFRERLLHGWTHRRAHRPGIVSWATGQADECAGLSVAAFDRLIRHASEDFQRVTGSSPRGFLPPAWRLSRGGLAALRGSGFEFAVGYGKVRRLDGEGADLRLATWSWDWGKIGVLGRWGEWAGHGWRCFSPRAIPCVAIHPIDLERGHVRRAVAIVRGLLDQGWRPSTIAEILELGA